MIADIWNHVIAIACLPLAIISWALLQRWIVKQEPTIRGPERGSEGGCCGGRKRGTCDKTGPKTCH